MKLGPAPSWWRSGVVFGFEPWTARDRNNKPHSFLQAPILENEDRGFVLRWTFGESRANWRGMNPAKPDTAPGIFPAVNSRPAMQCGGCFYWAEQPNTTADLKAPRVGLCRRFPPTLQVVGAVADPAQPRHAMPNLQPLRPWLVAEDYCGEFLPKS